MALQLNWIIFFHLFIILLRSAEGVTQMNLTAGKAFQKRPFNLTCEVFGGSVSGALEYTRPLGGVVVQCDNSFDISNCDIQIPGYSVIASTSNTYTLNVASFSPKNDEGIWTCTDSAADTVTGKLNVTSSAVYSVVTNELPWIKNNSQSLDVSVVGVCTYQAAQCTWTYTVSGESEEPVPTELIKDHTDAAPCSSEDVQTTCSLQFSTVPDNFSRKLLRINVSVSHISLDGPLVPEGSPFIYFPESTTVGTTPSSTVVCVCDCTVALCVLQAVWMVVVVVYLILCLTVLNFKPRWIVLVVFGFIQIVLGLISVGCLSIEHTCSSCKSDAYVAGAVFCALSLLCGTVVVIVVLLLKVIRKPPSGTLNVSSEGKMRPPPEGQAETLMIKDEKKSPQSVPPTATTTVNSSRQLPPVSGNVSGDEGKKPRPLPASTGNVSPTVTSASQIDTDVNNEAQDDVMKTPSRLPPLEMTETETEKPKKKKKKKKSKKAEDHREKGEDSEEGNDDNQREEKSKESDTTENHKL